MKFRRLLVSGLSGELDYFLEENFTSAFAAKLPVAPVLASGVMLLATILVIPRLRRFAFEGIFPLLSFFLIVTAVGMLGLNGFKAANLLFVFVAKVLWVAVCCLDFHASEKISPQGEDELRRKAPGYEGVNSYLYLALGWIGAVAIGVAVAFPGQPAIELYEGDLARQTAKQWIEVLEKGSIAEMRAFDSRHSASEALRDPELGQFIFYSATDASPKVLDAFLSLVIVPKEFLERALPRLESQKNCRAFRRLQAYARAKQYRSRELASLRCNSR